MCTCITCSVLERNYFLTHILNASYDVKWNRMVIGLSFDIRVQFLLLKLGLTAWLVSSSFTADKWFLFFPLYNGKLLKYLFFRLYKCLSLHPTSGSCVLILFLSFPTGLRTLKSKSSVVYYQTIYLPLSSTKTYLVNMWFWWNQLNLVANIRLLSIL